MKIAKILNAPVLLLSGFFCQWAAAETYTYDTLTPVDRFSHPQGWKDIPLHVARDGNAGLIRIHFDFEDIRSINALVLGPQGEWVARIADRIGTGKGDVKVSFDVDAYHIDDAYGEWHLRIISYSKPTHNTVLLEEFSIEFADDNSQLESLGEGTLPFGDAGIQGEGTLPFGISIHGDGTLPFGITGDGTLPFGVTGDRTHPFGVTGDGTLPFGKER